MLEPLTGKFEGINWAVHCEKFASFLLNLKQAIPKFRCNPSVSRQ